MPKGSGVVIAGTAYPRARKAKVTSGKRKVATAVTRRKKGKLSGSGDYKYYYQGDTPFAKVGRILGNKIGLGYWGEMLGHGIGRILGSGDYETGPMVKSNVLVNTTDVPEFGAIGRANVIVHREFLGDVVTSGTAGAFNSRTFKIQPGDSVTFPWLSTIAENYEQYRIHGMVFYFKSTSGDSVGSVNTSLGTVIMSTDYNVNSLPYASKQEMENAQFAQSGKSSVNQMHGIECDVSDKPINNYFVRTGALTSGDSLKWYDYANFQIATSGFQGTNVTVGELWCSYVIEFFKPQVPRNLGGTQNTAVVRRTSPTAALGFGSIGVSVTGAVDLTPTGSALSFNGVYAGQYFQITTLWRCTAATAFTAPTMTFSGCSAQGIGPRTTAGAATSAHQAPNNTVVTDQYEFTVWMAVSATNYTGACSVGITGYSGGINAADTVTIYVNEVDSSAI